MEHQLRERKRVQIAWTSNRVPEVLSDLILNSHNLVPGHLVSSFQNTACREASHRVITYDREPVPWGKIETTYISQVEESKRQKIQLQALTKLSFVRTLQLPSFRPSHPLQASHRFQGFRPEPVNSEHHTKPKTRQGDRGRVATGAAGLRLR